MKQAFGKRKILENECRYKFLSIKGGMNFLRHYYPLITKWHALLTKGGWHFSFNTKGQLISKYLLGVLSSFKKPNENNSTWG